MAARDKNIVTSFGLQLFHHARAQKTRAARYDDAFRAQVEHFGGLGARNGVHFLHQTGTLIHIETRCDALLQLGTATNVGFGRSTDLLRVRVPAP